jgi:tRNA-2-methylthio-N6-dimethylallyladenosine synthase
MSNHTVHIKSFGCQMNKLDTSLVTAALKDAGFGLTDDVKQADAVLLNTCSVRRHAEQKVLSHLGHLKHIRQSNPDLVVAVIGCMAQRLGAELLSRDEVDIVCGPAQIPQITGLLAGALQQKRKQLAITQNIRRQKSQNTSLEEFESVYDGGDKQLPNQAFVRVMHGCDNFCSYCIVPYVRGPEISRPPQAVIEQIKKLAGGGVKQVTLLGQRVNAYKYTTSGKTYCLADLLELAGEVDGIEWLRFVTSYPAEEFYDQILQAMRDLPKLCSHLHIPAQSGSDKILHAMNRKYSASKYLELIERARAAVPNLALAGDFIVGFPDESEQDFEQTVSLVQKVRYKNCFVFKYSPRPGTAADKSLLDTVPPEVKKQRNIRLLAVQEQISSELSSRFAGKTVKVLVEGLSKKPHLDAKNGENRHQLVGRTAEDWIVVFAGQPHLAGRFVNVKITRTSPLTLFGELA